MKFRRNLYLILGILLIVLNSLVTLPRLNEIKNQLSNFTYGIGYLIGTFFLSIIGILLLFGAARVQKKIKLKMQQDLENAFLAKVEHKDV